jgi:hypothetical protein
VRANGRCDVRDRQVGVCVVGGPIPVVSSVRAAWLFVSFLPICIAAGLTLAMVRRITL